MYIPDDDPSKTYLGERQWKWLNNSMKEEADVRILVSSIQVIADGHGYEKWGNLPIEKLRLFNLIDKNGTYFWYDFQTDEVSDAYDCKYFDFKALKASKQLIYENYAGKPIEHSYKYNFRHWSLIKVDSVIDLESGDFILK